MFRKKLNEEKKKIKSKSKPGKKKIKKKINKKDDKMSEISNNRSLFVGDMSSRWTEQRLEQFFSKIGPVFSVKVCRDFVSGNSLGYGYVNYLKYEDAKKAIEVLNFFKKPGICSKPIRILWDNKNKALRNSGIGNIFIKNLPFDFDSKALLKMFSAFGEILSAKVMLDGNGISKGFGFVHYKKLEDSKKAIEKTNGLFIKKKKIFVGPFIPKSVRILKVGITKRIFTNIYIKNIILEKCDESFVRDLFDVFGDITSIFVPKKKNRPIGIAFVNFKTRDQAEMAIFIMHKKNVRGKELFVGEAKNKLERQRMLKRRFLKKKMGEFLLSGLHNLVVLRIPHKGLNKKFLIFHKKIWNNLKYCKVYYKKKNEKSKRIAFFCLKKDKNFCLKTFINRKKIIKKNKIKIIDFRMIEDKSKAIYLKNNGKNSLKIKKKIKILPKIKNKFIYLIFSRPIKCFGKFFVKLLIRWISKIKKFNYKIWIFKIFLMKKKNIVSLFFCKLISKKKNFTKSFSKNWKKEIPSNNQKLKKNYLL